MSQTRKLRVRQVRRKKRTGNIDSREWRLPVVPPETSFATLPFTIQGPLGAFGTDAGKGTIDYSGVQTALVSGLNVTCTNSPNFAFRVTHVGVYGPTSMAVDSAGFSTQAIVTITCANSGRNVRGVSSFADRCRAGIEVPLLRQWKWYDGGNNDTISEKEIAYIRVNSANQCPGSTNSASYDVVVRGYVRFSRKMGVCSAFAPSPPDLSNLTI